MPRNPTERLFDELKAERDRRELGVSIAYCIVCGQPIDYCQGHGVIGDPDGFAILVAHDLGQHDDCDPHGCDEGEVCPEGPCAHPSHDIWLER